MESRSRKKLIRITESDIRRIVRESVNKLLNEDDLEGEELNAYVDSLGLNKKIPGHRWDNDAWEMPTDEYNHDPFKAENEGQFNSIEKTNRMNKDSLANKAMDIHNQRNSPYGANMVMGYDNTEPGRRWIEKWTDLDKSRLKI